MPLREELAANGAWLFRHRSYLPLLGLGLVLTQLPRFSYLGDSRNTQLLWSGLCLAIGLIGLMIRVHVAGHAPLGTSTRGTRAPAASQVNMTGFYSVVRHPLYLANMVMWLGIVLFVHVWWLVVLVVLLFWLYHERIIFAEEEMLRDKFGAAWLEWAARTPTFVPRLRLWKAPSCAFCLRQALRREYAGFFALIATFTALELASTFMVTGEIRIDVMWGTLFALGLATFLVFRWLTHHTNALNQTGMASSSERGP